MGHKVKTAKRNSHDTDVTVRDKTNNIVLAISAKNEKPTSYFTFLTDHDMQCDLRGAENQLIICSFGNWYDSTMDEWETISNFDDVIALGYQTLPSDYHAYYSNNNDVYKRRVDNDETYEDLKNRIKWYLIRIGLMPKTT